MASKAGAHPIETKSSSGDGKETEAISLVKILIKGMVNVFFHQKKDQKRCQNPNKGDTLMDYLSKLHNMIISKEIA